MLITDKMFDPISVPTDKFHKQDSQNKFAEKSPESLIREL